MRACVRARASRSIIGTIRPQFGRHTRMQSGQHEHLLPTHHLCTSWVCARPKGWRPACKWILDTSRVPRARKCIHSFGGRGRRRAANGARRAHAPNNEQANKQTNIMTRQLSAVCRQRPTSGQFAPLVYLRP